MNRHSAVVVSWASMLLFLLSPVAAQAASGPQEGTVPTDLPGLEQFIEEHPSSEDEFIACLHCDRRIMAGSLNY